MKKLWGVFVLLAVAWDALAQDSDALLRAAMYINGAGSAEDVEEWQVEQLQGMRPVQVNAPGRNARMVLSEYQLASLEDYRSRCGDILSFQELALVDGFGQEAVEALKPFLSLWSPRLPGRTDTVRTKATALARVTEKNIGAKARITGPSWQVAGALRSGAWTQFKKGSGTFHAQADFRKWSLTLGDYNVRYGQGVAHWSGFSMTSLSTPGAFLRRSTGISPLFSFTAPEHRGAAFEYSSGLFNASAFADLGGFAGAHAGRLWRHFQLGCSMYYDKALLLSLDGRMNFKGVDLAGEMALKNGSAGGQVAGSFKIKDARLVFQSRILPTRFTAKKNGEYGLAAGAQWKSGTWKQLSGKTGFGSSIPEHDVSITADASLLPIPIKAPDRRQLRIYATWKWQMSGTLALETRYTARLRNYDDDRKDLRFDLKYTSGNWLSNARLEGVYCTTPGALIYLEGGYKNDSFQSWLRLTAFSTGGWSSRLFCYERDAPGSFSVPALSGHGLRTSLYTGWKHRFTKSTLKLYLKATATLSREKPASAGLAFQMQLEI